MTTGGALVLRHNVYRISKSLHAVARPAGYRLGFYLSNSHV